jgi:hypothetical protein
MTPIENLTSAFETLWETKIHLMRTIEGVDSVLAPKLRDVLQQVAATRNQVEKLLIELQEKPPVVPGPPPR